ncbi:MAG: type II toxin-antitoxin system VapC family toxin [Thermoplasmatota archaeon]
MDTSAWIALHEPRDQNHTSAKARLTRLVESHELLVSGWHTLVEFADGLARHYDQSHASREIARLRASPRLRIEDSEPHHDAALAIFDDMTSWNVDLSDCLSFALMRSAALERVFTYDTDFAKAGFEVLG